MNAGDPRAAPFLPQIESLRGVAALGVAFGHCAVAALFTPKPYRGGDWLFYHLMFDPIKMLMDGRAGVILFFVISGLVLSLALDKVPAFASPAAFAGFVARRSLRIFPAHLAALILFVPVAYLTVFRVPVADPAALDTTTELLKWWLDGTVYGHVNPREWFHTAILYNNFYNPVTWTLQVEMLGSLCMPGFAALSRRGRWAVDAGALVALLGIAASVQINKAPGNFLLYLPAFYLGCMVRTHGRRLADVLAATPRLRIPALLASLLLLLVPPALIDGTSRTFIACASVGASGVVTIVAWAGGTRINAALLNPALRRLGRVSYSFYLWHDLILIGFVRTLLILCAPVTLAQHYVLVQTATVIITTAVTAVVANLSFIWIERPFIALGLRVFRTPVSREGVEGAGANR